MIMPFVQAKCPMCGGMLAVDDTKKAAVCQFCGDAFVVEEAVNNYITNNIINNTVNNNIGDGAVVNVIEQSKSIPVLLERVSQFLEDKDWEKANQYCEEILDIDPKNAQAYLGKLMAELHAQKKTDLVKHKSFDSSVNYQRILNCGDKSVQDELKAYLLEANGKNRCREIITKYRESEINYQKDCKYWKEQVDSIERAYKKKVIDILSAEKETKLADIEDKHSKTINQLAQQLETLKLEKSKVEASLKALGIFSFSERQRTKQSITELNLQIEKTECRLNDAQQNFNSEKEKLKAWENSRRKQITDELKNDYPIPAEPERLPVVLDDGTTVTPEHFNNEFVMDCIMDAMKPGVFYERNDFFEIVSEFKKVNIMYIAAISNGMVERGYLEKTIHEGETYFKLR